MKSPAPNEESISLETIFKYNPNIGRTNSEIFDTTYNVQIREGTTYVQTIHWESRKHLIATALCTSIGVACLWRFPTYTYIFGGATFLYVYVVLMFLIGHPLFYYEILIGQLSSLNPSTHFGMCPILEGLSWSMCLVSIFMLLYFGLFSAYMCIYMTKSFGNPLPWMVCENNTSCWNKTTSNQLLPPEKFFYKNIMGIKLGIDSDYWETSVIHWPVVVFLCVIWICVYICIVIDVRTSRMFPTFLIILVFLLTIPMIVGTQLTEGATRGLGEYFVPIPLNLINFELWWQALIQVLFSLGLSSGQTLMFGAYSQFMTPVYNDCISICAVIVLASLICGGITFGGLGILAQNIPNRKCIVGILKRDPGSVFIFYSVAFSSLPFRSGWAFLVYLVAAIQIMFTMVEVVETIMGMLHEYKKIFKESRRTSGAIISIILFLSSLPGSTQIGRDMIMVLDIYPIGMGLGSIAILEIFLIYLYHPKRLSNRKMYVFGKDISKYFIYSWYYIPFLILIIFIMSNFINPVVFPHLFPHLETISDNLIRVEGKIVGWIFYSFVMLALLIKSIYNLYFYWKKKKLKEFIVVKESKTLLEFANAAAPHNRRKLVPTPTPSTQTNVAGPSSARVGWKHYYELPHKYFDVNLDAHLDDK